MKSTSIGSSELTEILVVNGKNIEERDHTGGKAGELYQKIVNEGANKINRIEQILGFLKQISP